MCTIYIEKERCLQYLYTYHIVANRRGYADCLVKSKYWTVLDRIQSRRQEQDKEMKMRQTQKETLTRQIAELEAEERRRAATKLQAVQRGNQARTEVQECSRVGPWRHPVMPPSHLVSVLRPSSCPPSRECAHCTQCILCNV